MRLMLGALLVALTPVLASAQTSTLAPVPPLPPIGLPLPDITAPLTPLGLSNAGAPAPKAPQRPRQRFDFRRRHVPQPSAVFFVPVYYPWPVMAVTAAPVAVPAAVTEPAPAENAPRAAASHSEDPPAPPRVELPPVPSTFYFIPGCYMGNVPPSEVVLPANCDRSRLITRKP